MKLAYPILLITCVFFLTSPYVYTTTYSFSTENGMHKIGLKTKINKNDTQQIRKQFVFLRIPDKRDLGKSWFFASTTLHSKILPSDLLKTRCAVGNVMVNILAKVKGIKLATTNKLGSRKTQIRLCHFEIKN